MRVVTVATKSDGYFPYLIESCNRFGIHLDVLGWNTQWQGFNHRLHLLQEYLDTLDDHEVVMFIDAYDVIFLRDIIALEWEYKQKAGDKVAIAVEEMSALGATAYNYVIFGRCTGKALNAGTYMGYVHLVKKMLLSVNSKKKHGDDQRAITDLCRKQRETFYLDDKSEWFLVSGGDEVVDNEIEYVDGQMTYRGMTPYLLHCPGNRDMRPYLLALGYTAPAKELHRSDYRWKILFHQGRQLTERAFDALKDNVIVLFLLVTIVLFTFRPQMRRFLQKNVSV